MHTTHQLCGGRAGLKGVAALVAATKRVRINDVINEFVRFSLFAEYVIRSSVFFFLIFQPTEQAPS